MKGRLFVSHAETDSKLAEAFIEMVKASTGLEDEDIFCSSVRKHGLKMGTKRIATIRRALRGSPCVLLLVTRTFLEREFCMYEVGATWVEDKPCGCVVVPPVEFAELPELIGELECADAQESEDIHEICRLAAEGMKRSIDDNTWTSVFKTFQSAMADGLAVSRSRSRLNYKTFERQFVSDNVVDFVEDALLRKVGEPERLPRLPTKIVRHAAQEAGFAGMDEIGQWMLRHKDAVLTLGSWRVNNRRRDPQKKGFPFCRGEALLVICQLKVFATYGQAALADFMDRVYPDVDHAQYAHSFATEYERLPVEQMLD